SLLATTQDRPHITFRRQEESRRAGLMKRAQLDAANLERWTDALGFCDLLSLYMCCGITSTSRIPRGHPARKLTAPPIEIAASEDSISLSEQFIPSASKFEVH